MDEYLNQTALGRLFDVSSHVIGRWLEQVQLRGPDQRPTPTAIQGGFTKTVPTSRHEGIAYFVWHAEKTIRVLEKAGYRRRCDAPPLSAGSPSGPFHAQTRDRMTYEISDGSGRVVCVVGNRQLADRVVALLELAAKHNKL
jgi:hypothetical protein